jgi:hypothetical protein
MVRVFFEDTIVPSGSTMPRLTSGDVTAKDCSGTIIGAGALLGEVDDNPF